MSYVQPDETEQPAGKYRFTYWFVSDHHGWQGIVLDKDGREVSTCGGGPTCLHREKDVDTEFHLSARTHVLERITEMHEVEATDAARKSR